MNTFRLLGHPDITMARLREQAVKTAQKWNGVLLSHDEIVCSVPEKDAEQCLKEMLDTLSMPPAREDS